MIFEVRVIVGVVKWILVLLIDMVILVLLLFSSLCSFVIVLCGMMMLGMLVVFLGRFVLIWVRW